MLDGDIQNFKKKVLKLLVECAVNMPEKCTIYSTLVGLLNAKNYNFGGEVSELNLIIKYLQFSYCSYYFIMYAYN